VLSFKLGNRGDADLRGFQELGKSGKKFCGIALGGIMSFLNTGNKQCKFIGYSEQ
jgi:hypothetical protein